MFKPILTSKDQDNFDTELRSQLMKGCQKSDFEKIRQAIADIKETSSEHAHSFITGRLQEIDTHISSIS